jgi:gas vesicle protein
MKIMAEEMSDAFKEIADYVSNWQEEFSGQIDTMLEEIKELVQSINEAISKSAELAGEKSGAGELIGSAEAIELLNATG